MQDQHEQTSGKCPECDGSGKVAVAYKRPILELGPCPVCDGKGRIIADQPETATQKAHRLIDQLFPTSLPAVIALLERVDELERRIWEMEAEAICESGRR